jgi:hypothetical protein
VSRDAKLPEICWFGFVVTEEQSLPTEEAVVEEKVSEDKLVEESTPGKWWDDQLQFWGFIDLWLEVTDEHADPTQEPTPDDLNDSPSDGPVSEELVNEETVSQEPISEEPVSQEPINEETVSDEATPGELFTFLTDQMIQVNDVIGWH